VLQPPVLIAEAKASCMAAPAIKSRGVVG